MGIFTWIILGAISGWLASIITSNNKKMGLVKNVLIGILGAIIGGWIFSYYGVFLFPLLGQRFCWW
jgi:uncharacterized membrane protein YeaQ/YmgE (transglycosylase-associated protein family)